MSRKTMLFLFCAFMCAVITVMYCGSPKNPYVPENASIAVFLKNSRDVVQSAEIAATDTVGNTLRVGVCPRLYTFIDSVEITVRNFTSSGDSVIGIKQFTSDQDTLWFGFTFTKIRKYDFTVNMFQGSKIQSVPGQITIIGKSVTAVISPATDSGVVDSLASFTVTPHGDDPFTYQWFLGATLLTGKTGVSLIINHRAFTDSGEYTCLVKDKWGDSTVAGPARLVVTPKPVVVINTKPVLVVTGRKNILNTEICTLTVTVTDPDSGQTESISMIRGPSGSTFANNKMTWAPASGFIGADTAVFTVRDNGVPPLSDTQKVAIVVSATILPPDSVKGIAGVSRIGGIFIFKWNKAAHADAYVVFRSKDTAGFTRYATVSDSSFTNNIKDTAFYYYIVAINSINQSAPSQIIHSTVINAAPQWAHGGITASVNEGNTISINLADSVSDVNGDNVTLQLENGKPAADSLVGTTWKYTPSYSDSGLYTVKIKAWDGTDSSILTITLLVVNVPRPPQPQAQSLSTNRNTALQIVLTAIDPDGDAITSWAIDTQTTHGTTSMASSGQPNVTYTPATGFIGTDYFTFKVSVGSLSSTYSAKVAIRVDTNNIAPVISQKLSAKTLNKGDSLVLSVPINSDAFPAPKFYWYKNSAPALDSTSISSWKKLSLALSDSGFYYVIVKNSAGQDSSGAKVTMQCAPVISQKLAATTAVNAASQTQISVTVNADATPAPTYQWYFNGQAIATNGTSAAYSKTWAITDTGTYKVIVSNAAGKDSTFTKLIVNLPPGTPVLVSPADAAVNQPVSLTLTWNKIAIASSYYVQVASDTAFATVVASDSTLTDTVKTVSALSNSTTYYWRVRAKNTVGVSSWTVRRSFTTIIASPTAPTLVSPADAAASQPVSLTLLWRKIAVAASYYYQVATDTGFATIVSSDSTLTDTTTAVSGLVNNTTYYWRARSKNAAGVSTWSGRRSFTTIVASSSVPALVSPADGATSQPLSLTLMWRKIAVATSYYYQVATDTGFGTLKASDSTLTDTTVTVSGLLNYTTYYWRVRSKNAAGASSWSARRSFTTVGIAPVLARFSSAIDTVKQGSPINLNAQFTTAPVPAGNYKWFKNKVWTLVKSTVNPYNVSATAVYSDSGLYTVSDSNIAGVDTASVLVIIKDTTHPVINLHGSGDTTILLGSIWADPVTASDGYDVNLTISKSVTVVTTAPAKFTVNYNVTDTWGNAAVQQTRIVRVQGWEHMQEMSVNGFSVTQLSNGDLYMASTEIVQGDLYLYKLNDTIWQQVGGLVKGTFSNYKFALTRSWNKSLPLYLVYGSNAVQGGQTIINQWNGSVWDSSMGKVGSSLGSTNCKISSSGIPFVFYNNYPYGRATLSKYNTASNSFDYPPLYVEQTDQTYTPEFDLTIDSMLYLAYDDPNVFGIPVKKCNNGNANAISNVGNVITDGTNPLFDVMMDESSTPVPHIFATNAADNISPEMWVLGSGGIWASYQVKTGAVRGCAFDYSTYSKKFYAGYIDSATGMVDSCYLKEFDGSSWQMFPSLTKGKVPINSPASGQMWIFIGQNVYYLIYPRNDGKVGSYRYRIMQ
jgi:hypothetical protein